MNTYPNIDNESELLKIKTRDDEVKKMKYQTEEHDHENILKSLKKDSENCKKKNENLIKKKMFMIVSEILIGSVGLSVGSGSTISGLAPLGIMCASSMSFLSSV